MFELAYSATDAFEGRAGYAEERVHFGGGVFVLTGGVVNEDIIGLLDFARSGAAERGDGRGDENTHIGEQIVTLSNVVRSIFIGSIGISQRCIPKRQHHQNPKVPAVRSVALISYTTAPKRQPLRKPVF